MKTTNKVEQNRFNVKLYTTEENVSLTLYELKIIKQLIVRNSEDKYGNDSLDNPESIYSGIFKKLYWAMENIKDNDFEEFLKNDRLDTLEKHQKLQSKKSI